MHLIFQKPDSSLVLNVDTQEWINWDKTASQPEDIGGWIGHRWREQGSPQPDPYVAPPPPPPDPPSIADLEQRIKVLESMLKPD
jgi:hypothetical protein